MQHIVDDHMLSNAVVALVVRVAIKVTAMMVVDSSTWEVVSYKEEV